MDRAGLSDNLPDHAGRSLLAFVCTHPGVCVPDELVQTAASEELRTPWLVEAAERVALTSLVWGSLTPAQRCLLPGELWGHHT